MQVCNVISVMILRIYDADSICKKMLIQIELLVGAISHSTATTLTTSLLFSSAQFSFSLFSYTTWSNIYNFNHHA